ncbi:MAG: hypothetical protein LBR15_05480 [Methanobrevibacter sp.]|nr:hypothetical protein [Candidatus Methanovirga australis]
MTYIFNAPITLQGLNPAKHLIKRNIEEYLSSILFLKSMDTIKRKSCRMV